MNIDLKTIPFSCRGSYLVVSQVSENWCGCVNPSGIYLRTVRGGAAMPLIARLQITWQGKPTEVLSELEQATLVLKCAEGQIEFCFDGADTLLVRGSEGMELMLDFLPDRGAFDYLYSFERDGRKLIMANSFKNSCRYLLWAEYGSGAIDQEWQEKKAIYSRLTFLGEKGFLFALREITTEWDGVWKKADFESSCRSAADSLRDFERGLPSCPVRFKLTAKRAAYLLWASLVHKDGLLPREAMLMSKNWMKSVWSWDHCFNAIALSYAAPKLAWDQLMILFDCQDPTGLLPDSISDARFVWNFCKPPIHGWALRWMMKNMTLTREQLQEAYDRLSQWTRWWLVNRDYDGDGLYEYNHGNDSGWDNSTAFSVLPPIATPELQAFLIIQMDVLSDLAGKLGQSADAERWKQKADRLLGLLTEGMFEDGLPVVRRSQSHETVPNDSLLPYISIVLGERLPEDLRRRMTEVLSGPKFRTAHGFATEAPESPCYLSDGYWRGPIWAPSTMLIADGLDRCGEKELARETAERFAEMAASSGFAENFDAVTGAGLRDRAYTWTASAFLTMTHEYL